VVVWFARPPRAAQRRAIEASIPTLFAVSSWQSPRCLFVYSYRGVAKPDYFGPLTLCLHDRKHRRVAGDDADKLLELMRSRPDDHDAYWRIWDRLFEAWKGAGLCVEPEKAHYAAQRELVLAWVAQVHRVVPVAFIYKQHDGFYGGEAWTDWDRWSAAHLASHVVPHLVTALKAEEPLVCGNPEGLLEHPLTTAFLYRKHIIQKARPPVSDQDMDQLAELFSLIPGHELATPDGFPRFLCEPGVAERFAARVSPELARLAGVETNELDTLAPVEVLEHLSQYHNVGSLIGRPDAYEFIERTFTAVKNTRQDNYIRSHARYQVRVIGRLVGQHQADQDEVNPDVCLLASRLIGLALKGGTAKDRISSNLRPEYRLCQDLYLLLGGLWDRVLKSPLRSGYATAHKVIASLALGQEPPAFGAPDATSKDYYDWRHLDILQSAIGRQPRKLQKAILDHFPAQLSLAVSLNGYNQDHDEDDAMDERRASIRFLKQLDRSPLTYVQKLARRMAKTPPPSPSQVAEQLENLLKGPPKLRAQFDVDAATIAALRAIAKQFDTLSERAE
jgi:hypothetical protein